jgi:hypothetical protein
MTANACTEPLSEQAITGAASHETDQWRQTDWEHAHRIVRRLQARIVKAYQEGCRPLAELPPRATSAGATPITTPSAILGLSSWTTCCSKEDLCAVSFIGRRCGMASSPVCC